MGETRRHELLLIRAPQPMKLPPGPIICEVELPQAVKFSGNVPVHLRVFVNGKFYRRTVCYYEVADTCIIGPYDNTVKNQSDEEILTLLTCANKGTKRFVCHCIPVKEAGDVDE